MKMFTYYFLFLSLSQAPPTMSIWVNNKSYYSNGDVIYLPFNHSVTVSCNAIGSRPVVNVSFTVDNEYITRTNRYTTINVGQDGKTFDTRTTIILPTIKESGTLSCRSSSLAYYSERRLSVKYLTYGKCL